MDASKIVTCLADLEEAAEDILTDRQTIIDLDRTRNGNREALRHLRKQEEKKSWIIMGSTFFKLDTESVETILNKDQEKLDKEINDLRDNLKKKMDRIKDLEGRPALKGFDLKPLNRDEMSAIYRNITK